MNKKEEIRELIRQNNKIERDIYVCKKEIRNIAASNKASGSTGCFIF